LLQIAVETASCPFVPIKLLTQLQNRCYLFPRLAFLPFSLSFFLYPIPLAFRLILRAEKNHKNKNQKAQKRRRKEPKRSPKTKPIKTQKEKPKKAKNCP